MRNTNKNFLAICFSSVLLLVTVSMAVFYFTHSTLRAKKYHYPGFGIVMPLKYFIHGIDISHYQSAIGWQDVKLMEYQHIKIGFCFMKATEGTDKMDENYLKNWYEAKQMDIPVGAYHFFYAGTNGKAQAEHFISLVSLEKNDLPPVLDVEQENYINTDTLQYEIQDWLNTVENYYHVKPIIYTNINFYKEYLDGKFNNYPLWIANYLADEKPDIARNWIFWQHNNRGHVNGIEGYVDFNVFSGDSAAFKTLLIQ